MKTHLLALCVAVLPAACASQSRPADAAASRPLVIACWHNGLVHVYDVDGATSRPVITKPEPERPLIWTPDGKSIIFGRDNTPDWSFFSVDADGTHEHLLGPLGEDSRSPVFSGDGRFIAYVSGRRGLCVMQADGTGVRTVAPLAHRDAPPVWLGGGSHLEYVGVRARTSGTEGFHLDLRVVAAAPGPAPDDRLILNDTDDPAASPDGVWVAAVSGGDITLHGPGLMGVRTLAATPERESDPAWSPDGRQIACFARSRARCELWVYDFATGAHRVLATVDDRTSKPHWSPDGRWICFTAGESTPDVFMVAAAGGAPRRITTGGGSWPVFRPLHATG